MQLRESVLAAIDETTGLAPSPYDWEKSARRPRVLPDWASQFSLSLDAAQREQAAPLIAGIPLPMDLRDAVAHRQFEFRAGRFCAWRAVRAIVPGVADAPLGRLRSGAVAWPSGVTGSITHTRSFVSAAVAASCHASAIGIDCEGILSDERARHVARVVAWPVEVNACRDAALDRLTALTLVFSAKESIFKCVHAEVGRVFGFHDVRIIHVDAAARRFCARVMTALSASLTPGTELTGQYEIEDGRVHTGMFLPPTAAASSRP